MLEQTPSRTAFATALLRAMHIHLDDPPPVLDDRIAFKLLPAYQQRYLRRQATSWPARLRQSRQRYSAFTAMRSQIVVRTRYAEDSLAEVRQAGATRYVILGAGLDTFALRQPAPPIDVVEIDHPATQSWKQQLLRQRGITRPTTLSLLPVDFERSSLNDLWIENVAPDFISWLGTTYYLSREGILSTLTTLAERTEVGSELVLDYWREPPREADAPLLWGTRVAVALQGEPMRSFFDPREIEQLAVAAGWRVKENCKPSEQTSRYLANRKDGLSVPSFAYLLRLER